MGHPTAVLSKARCRRDAAAERRTETVRLVGEAGHEAQVRAIPRNSGPDLARVDCTCGKYRSAPGADSTAWTAWFSHARRSAQEAGVVLP